MNKEDVTIVFNMHVILIWTEILLNPSAHERNRVVAHNQGLNLK